MRAVALSVLMVVSVVAAGGVGAAATDAGADGVGDASAGLGSTATVTDVDTTGDQTDDGDGTTETDRAGDGEETQRSGGTATTDSTGDREITVEAGRPRTVNGTTRVALLVGVTNTSTAVPTGSDNVSLAVEITAPDGNTTTYSRTTNATGVAFVELEPALDGEYTVQVSSTAVDDTGYARFITGPRASFFPGWHDAVQIGRPVTVGVGLFDGGTPLANQQRTVNVTTPDGGTLTRTVTTGQLGTATFSFTPRSAGTYSVDGPGVERSLRLQAANVTGKVQFNGPYADNIVAGQAVGIYGQLQDGGQPYANRDISVSVVDRSNDTAVHTATTSTNAHGQFVVEWTTPSGVSADYRIEVAAANGDSVAVHGTGIDQQADTSNVGSGPAPAVSLAVDYRNEDYSAELAPGESATVDVRVTSDGAAVSGQRVDLRGTVGYPGAVLTSATATTNATGHATVNVTVPRSAPVTDFFELTAYATVNGTTYDESAYGEITPVALDQENDYRAAPGGTVNYSTTATDTRTGGPVSGVPTQVFLEGTAFHASVYANDTVVTGSDGIGRTSFDMPARTGEFFFGDWGPYRSPNYFSSFESRTYDVRVSANREYRAGETVTISYNATTTANVSASVLVAAGDDDIEQVDTALLSADRVAPGDPVTFTIPGDTPAGVDYEVTVSASTLDGNRTVVRRSFDVLERQTRTLTVDADGAVGNYTAIGPALDNATDGDTVEVRPGTYREAVVVDRNVTLVAPDGAVLNGSTLGGATGSVGYSNETEAGYPVGDASNFTAGVTITGAAHPTVAGFTVTDYTFGVAAPNTDGAWTFRNGVISNSSAAGVNAFESTGAWTLRDAAVVRVGDGNRSTNNPAVDARGSLGAWALRDVTVRDIDGGPTSAQTVTDAIEAVGAQGDWTVRNATVRNVAHLGIDTSYAAGDWEVRDSRVSNVSFAGIGGGSTSGEWQVHDTVIANVSGGLAGVAVIDPQARWLLDNVTVRNAPAGVWAEDSAVDWAVVNSTLAGNAGPGVDASASTGNWTVALTNVTDNAGPGVDARNTTGDWRALGLRLTGNVGAGVTAEGAAPAGNATYNWWGASDGPSGDFGGSGAAAVGNLTVRPFFTDAGFESLSSDPVRLDVVPGETTTYPNDTFTVRVRTDTQGKDVFGAQALLTYNTSVLDAVNVSRGGFLSSDGTATNVYARSIDDANGTVDYGESRQGTNASGIAGEGTLFEVRFRVDANATTNRTVPLALSGVAVSDRNGSEVPSTVDNGSATVSANRAPSVNATLLTPVVNAGSEARIEVTAADPDGRVGNVTLMAPDGSVIGTAQCDASNCTRTFTATPPNSTWDGSGYATQYLTAVATDDDGGEGVGSAPVRVFTAGDATGDGVVDLFDAVALGRAWQATAGGADYSPAADLNNDGVVDIFDAVLVGKHWRDRAA